MTFWADPNMEPKRLSKWVLRIEGVDTFMCKKVGKPSFSKTEATHAFLNYVFKFPGRVEWEDVSLTLVDAIDPDVASVIVEKLRRSGYDAANIDNAAVHLQTISKKDSVLALGNVFIEQIDADGRPVERWYLRNAWVKSANFGELDYESDELLNIELTLTYDWAVQNPREF